MHDKQQFSNSLFRTISRAANVALAMAFVLALTMILTQAAQAQTYKVIYNFTGGADGSAPYAGLTMDKAGNLYGTTSFGGAFGNGAVFKLTPKGSGWVLTPLYSFQGGSDGVYPTARVIFGPDGSLYGTTQSGGVGQCRTNGFVGCGTVFNLRPQPRACTTALCPWTETVLYRFTGGSDGAVPIGDLVFDQPGAIYGATLYGGLPADCQGRGCGVVYKLARSNGSWAETALYSFTGGSDGGHPGGGVIFDQVGNLYGVASDGGASSCDSGDSSHCGTVYQLAPSGSGWAENTIFDFSTCCVLYPVGGLVFDAYGNLYGASYASPNPFGNKFVPGSVYEIQNSNNNWIQVFDISLLYLNPAAGVTMDAAGDLYGVANDDGERFDDGVAYELPASNGFAFTPLYAFSGGNDGGSPQGTVLLDANGDLYGTASEGGAHGAGVVWEITP